jgi:hypothetical protein
MPEANSAPILFRPSTRYPGSAPALALKPKLLNRLCQRNLAEGWGRVQVPHALDRKYLNAAADTRWQWVFPQESRWRNRETDYILSPVTAKGLMVVTWWRIWQERWRVSG